MHGERILETDALDLVVLKVVRFFFSFILTGLTDMFPSCAYGSLGES